MSGRGEKGEPRTAADRAAAAAERARRRGQSPPPMTAAGLDATPPAPAPPAPAPPPDPEPEPEPFLEPAPEEPADTRDLVLDQPVAPPPAPAEPRPAPPRREEDTAVVRPAPPLPRRAERGRDREPLAPRRPLPPSAPEGSRVGRRVFGVAVLLLVAALVFVGLRTFQPFHAEPTGLVRVTIPEGSSVGDIGELLERKGVIASSTFFGLNASVTGRRGGLRPGDYTLQTDMTYGTVLDALSRGPKAKVVKTFKLLVPEGFSIAENADRVAEGGVSGDYEAATKAPRAVRKAHQLGLPSGNDSTEGFLFPATYDLVEGADAGRLVDQQLSAFADNFGTLDLRAARKKNLTDYDVLIIASMVERETRLDRERPIVAGVIYNRLKMGMPLGIDATTRYEYQKWDSPLLQSELDADTPYNTRLNTSLPPTPIGNPGLASMEAAARPDKTDFLYYVVKPGTCGHAFSETDAEAQEAVAAYNAARDANGGNSPTPDDC